MRQALHIFAKDVRALWPQILVVLALTIAAPLPAKEDQRTVWALVIARWYLIVCAVHQEKLVGDRQWWLTRPYSWKSLLEAKALLVALFINLPSLVVDIAVLLSQGLPVGPAWESLLARQAVLVLVWQYGLPAMALAAVTPGLVSFALAAIATLAVFFAASSAGALERWGQLIWIPLSAALIVFATAAAVTLLWQFGRRRTLAARYMLLGAVAAIIALALLPPMGWGIDIQTHARPTPAEVENIRLASANQFEVTTMQVEDREATLYVGLSLRGIPAGIQIEPELFRLELEAQDGRRWNSGWRPAYQAWEWLIKPTASVSTLVPRETLESMRSRDVHMRLSLVLMVLGRQQAQVMSLKDSPVDVAGVGLCAPEERPVTGSAIECRSSIPSEYQIQISVTIPGNNGFARPFWWPLPVSFDASPVWRTRIELPQQWNGLPVTFLLRKPLAHLQRDLVIDRVRLPNF